MITILGPTASGKTSLAAALAYRLNSEIISADSRQVYRGMTIGTGKDLADYTINGKQIPYHLIDICDAGKKYNLFEYQRDFLTAYEDITSRGIEPILCGGTGLYIEAVLKGYRLVPVPENPTLRQQLEGKSLEELTAMLVELKQKSGSVMHNKTDVDSCKREERRQKITHRLKERLDNGMVDEVRGLLDSGIPADDLIYYGLEYKYLTEYITGKRTYNEMFAQLEIAIHQFAKRQMTWFRGMERRGFTIHWIKAEWERERQIEKIRELRGERGERL